MFCYVVVFNLVSQNNLLNLVNKQFVNFNKKRLNEKENSKVLKHLKLR